MDARTIQHVFAVALAQSALLCASAQAQTLKAQPSTPLPESAESVETPAPLLPNLLSRLREQEQPDEEQPKFNIDPLQPLPLGPAEPTAPDPIRIRKGGQWSLSEKWSVGVGMMRAGGPKPENRDHPYAMSEPTWMQVEGAEGLVHMLDASVNWVVDPVDDVQVSLEGGVRTLARSDRVSNQGADYSLAELDGNLVTLPVMGAAVRWALNDWAYVEGSATGDVMDFAGSFLDLTAQASVSLTAHTALIAGYRYLDASFDSAGDLTGDSATLRQDAIFAMLQIRY